MGEERSRQHYWDFGLGSGLMVGSSGLAVGLTWLAAPVVSWA